MTELLWQTTFLLAVAFFFGAALACGLKRRFYYGPSRRIADVAPVSMTPATPDASQPKIEVAARAVPEGQRFERALSGTAKEPAPAAGHRGGTRNPFAPTGCSPQASRLHPRQPQPKLPLPTRPPHQQQHNRQPRGLQRRRLWHQQHRLRCSSGGCNVKARIRSRHPRRRREPPAGPKMALAPLLPHPSPKRSPASRASRSARAPAHR